MKALRGRVAAVSTAAFLVASTAAFTIATQGTGLVGVVGNWKSVDDGGPTFKVDTAGWSGSTPRTALEPLARSLFTTANDSFFTNAMAPEAFPFAVHRGVRDFSKGTVKVQFKLVGGATDQIAGLVFNLKPNGEYFYVRYNTRDGNVAFWRFRNGTRARVTEGGAKQQLPLNAWHELSLTVDGHTLSAAVNGGALTDTYTATEPVSGRVGVWAKRDAITAFKNFQVLP